MTKSKDCPVCSKPFVRKSTVDLDWLSLKERRFYHETEVCTARFRAFDNKPIWKARETYFTSAREVAANGPV
jgi:hypothetical protein